MNQVMKQYGVEPFNIGTPPLDRIKYQKKGNFPDIKHRIDEINQKLEANGNYETLEEIISAYEELKKDRNLGFNYFDRKSNILTQLRLECIDTERFQDSRVLEDLLINRAEKAKDYITRIEVLGKILEISENDDSSYSREDICFALDSLVALSEKINNSRSKGSELEDRHMAIFAFAFNTLGDIYKDISWQKQRTEHRTTQHAIQQIKHYLSSLDFINKINQPSYHVNSLGADVHRKLGDLNRKESPEEAFKHYEEALKYLSLIQKEAGSDRNNVLFDIAICNSKMSRIKRSSLQDALRREYTSVLILESLELEVGDPLFDSVQCNLIEGCSTLSKINHNLGDEENNIKYLIEAVNKAEYFFFESGSTFYTTLENDYRNALASYEHAAFTLSRKVSGFNEAHSHATELRETYETTQSIRKAVDKLLSRN